MLRSLTIYVCVIININICLIISYRLMSIKEDAPLTTLLSY